MDSPERRYLWVGDGIHGFANGCFGRDSYICRTVQAADKDWLVLRTLNGDLEFISRKDADLIHDPNDRSYCSGECPAGSDG